MLESRISSGVPGSNYRRHAVAVVLASLTIGVILVPIVAGAQRLPAAERVVTGVCGDPVALRTGASDAVRPRVVTASDALLILRVSIQIAQCAPCLCDVDSSGSVSATDALIVLRVATGQPSPLNCPSCGLSSTTTSTLGECAAFAPEADLNFGVSAASAGVAGSAVAAEAGQSAHSADLYTSAGTGAHAPAAAGDNDLAVEESDLGLAAADELDAVSFGAFVPAPYQIYFSLRDADRTMGVGGTGVRDQSDTEVVPGDVFVSSGLPSPAQGSNALSLDEIELGLEPHDLAGGPESPDELDALDFSTPGDPYYLSVARGGGSSGADVFRATGAVATQILAASDLGLLDSDELDALVVQDVDDNGAFGPGDFLFFSVSLDSVGEAASPVNQQAILGEAAGDIYVSVGDGSHQLFVDEQDLGLLPTDDIDALELGRGAGEPECFCGDGILDPGEQCEVLIACVNPADACNLADCTCSRLFCEDGALTPPEQCEPGVFPCPPGRFCTPNCKCVRPRTCPDGFLDPGEQCESGIACPNAGDVCNVLNCQCVPESDPDRQCGDGIADPGEQCGEPGLACPAGQACNFLTCQCLPNDAFRCPNGMLDAGEECEVGIPCPSQDEFCIEANCTCTPLGCDPNGTIDLNPREACDPLAAPNGCEEGVSCNQECECVLYTPRCGDGVFTPTREECDRVQIGPSGVDAGCDPGLRCALQTCRCVPCIEPDPKTIEVIDYQGFLIPTCQLRLAGPDACDDQHWHGSAWAIVPQGGDITFLPDPAPGVCGFGRRSDTPPQTFQLGGDTACALVASGVVCVVF